METRMEKALQKRMAGYNCSQAVFCTYCEDFGIEESLGYRISEAFGSGMGGMQETCGAASAMFMLAGLANGDGQLGEKTTRPKTYEIVRGMAHAFQAMNTNLACKDIMKDLDAQGKRNHTCEDCVISAARIVEETLFMKNPSGKQKTLTPIKTMVY